jgi:hypothetical protein
MHVLRTAVAAPLVCAAVTVFIWWSGLGAYVLATVVVAVAAACVVAGAGWASWGNHPGRTAVAAGMATAALCLASYGAVGKPFSHGRLRVEMGRLDAPAGFRVVEEEAGGNLMCFDTCSERTKVWLVPAGTAGEAGDSFARFLRAAGFSLTTRADAEFTGVHRGRLAAQVTITTPDEAASWPIVVPPGHFVGRLTLFAT